MKLLSELNKEGTTIVMVTHSERDAGFAHRIVHLFDGKIITEEMKRTLEAADQELIENE
jgi:putative ABC transport system ATP-binding protein